MSIYNQQEYLFFLLQKLKLAIEREKQWLESLKNVPNGILIYNIKEN
jgi:hypothetical protein